MGFKNIKYSTVNQSPSAKKNGIVDKKLEFDKYNYIAR